MRAVFLKQSSVLLLSASLLAACGGGGGDSPAGRSGEPATRELTFAYPADGQTEIATPAPVVLRFTDRVDASAVENDVTLTRVDTGDTVAFTATPVGTDGRTLLLQPGQDLAAHTEYRVDLQTLQLDNGVDNLTFTTRAAQRGPRSETITSEQFALNRRYPNGGTQEPVMDFSTFRYQFSQPIDPATATYGEAGNVRIVDSEGDLVEARLLVDGPYMTVDPVPDYLTPGEEYRLYLEDGLTSTYGLPLDGENIRFTPKDSSPDGEPAILVQKVTVPGDAGTGDGTSRLTGKPINQVPVNSTLLGNDSATQSEGNVAAELASSVVYPFVTPIRVPRNTLLTGSNIDVMIGGAVPAGIRSGKVKMHFLSDATGYLTSNPYSTRDDALRQIRLFMDVAIATENPEANGGFTQDLLHIELVGMAEVDTDAGVLNLDAVSMVEPDVLGQEFAHGLLSFQLQSYPDQTSAPPGSVDDAAPTLQSWTFGEDGATGLDKTAMIKPTDPIILNFSEPLDRDTVTGKVHLYKNEGGTQTEMDTTVTVDGGAIVIRPAQPLEHPTETGPSLEYQVSIDAGITDLSGEPWVEPFNEIFGLPSLVEMRQGYKAGFFGPQMDGPPTDVQDKSVFVLGLYPGFPCPLNTATRNLQPTAGQPMLAGRCIGGVQPHPNDDLGTLEPLPADDILPVPDMPANRPIVVVFSKDIDPASLFDDQGNATTFSVYEVDPQTPDAAGPEVEGKLALESDTLYFTPNQPWDEGMLYAYRLKSNGSVDATTVECDANQPAAGLCGQDGLPLATQMLVEVSTHDGPRIHNTPPIFGDHFIWEEAAPTYTSGGPDLIQYFVGAAPTKNVLQLLRLGKGVDRNANLINDSAPQADINSLFLNGDLSYNQARIYDYENSETDGVVWEDDPSTADLMDSAYGDTPIDPNGVKPPVNSAKILSTFYGWRDLGDFAPEGLKTKGGGSNVVGASIGCAFDSFIPFDVQSGPDGNCGDAAIGSGFPTQCYWAEPSVCPEDKFTYLNGVLFAEVTDETTQNGDLKVYIHPGHIVTTSFKTFTKTAAAGTQNLIDTGFQVMRMRFADDRQLIEGTIAPGANGPSLSTNVHLYLDAPFLREDIVDIKRMVSAMHHNFYSYPVEMDLSGDVSFLSDGRMVVDQHNDNEVHFTLMANIPRTLVELMVPERGTFLRYVSEPIK